MLSNFYWVLKNEIAGMGLPTASRAYIDPHDVDLALKKEFEQEINDLKQYGIGAVVSLTEIPLNSQPILDAGMEYLHIPVPDMTAPTQSQIADFVAFCRRNIQAQRPVVVHCLGGSGRTGTMISCYLVSKGYNTKKAIQTVRKYKPGAVETRWQEEAIYEYEWTRRNPESQG